MPFVEILDGPPEWAGVVYETDEDMVADEIGLIHPRWRGTPVWVGWGALYFYRKVEVAGSGTATATSGHLGLDPAVSMTGWRT